MANCHNQIAFHGNVPAKKRQEAESHYKKVIDLFNKAENPIETTNAERNL